MPSSDIYFVIVFATLWAWMEVEIEGKHGWAQKLPTACAFMGWTWYHVCMNLIVIILVQRGLRCVQFQEGCAASLVLFVLYTVAWFVIEDVMWFVLNPSYGIARYNVADIPWHASKAWVCGTFVYNWIVLVAWCVAAVVQLRCWNSAQILCDMIVAAAFVLTMVLISISRPSDYTSPDVSNSGCYLK
jgi:hypothetical protein